MGNRKDLKHMDYIILFERKCYPCFEVNMKLIRGTSIFFNNDLMLKYAPQILSIKTRRYTLWNLQNFHVTSVFPALSTQPATCLTFSSACCSLSSSLSVCSFPSSNISLPDILAPVLTQTNTCTHQLFLSCCYFNPFPLIPAFWFTGKAAELQILKLGGACGRKFTEYMFSFYKGITHLQPSLF